ncbi:MAG TPA: hypothetical protein VF037_10050 [Gemmatimonadales bacterium]
MIRLAVVAAAMLAMGGAPLMAQGVASLESRLDPGTAGAVRRIVDSASTAGLPPGPLVNKALEGASKGAAPERIVVAVRSLAADLGAARAALGSSATEAELVAGVGALRAGADGDVLARVKRARGESSALLPLAVLSDLVARGIPVDRAQAVILGLAERRAEDGQYRALPRAVGRGGEPAYGPPESPGRSRSGGEADPAPPPRGRPEAPPAKGRPQDLPGKGSPAQPPVRGRPVQP